MKTVRLTLPALAALMAVAPGTRADDLLPTDRPIAAVVDHYLDARLKEEGITPAPPADDANLIRRLTLDLAGRIPTVAETQTYLDSTDPDKRVRLVDRLLASPGFVRHQANELDVMLMAGTKGSLRDYLSRAVAEGQPWDQVFRDLLLPDENDPKQKGAGVFLRERVKDLDKLTNEVSTTFFGVNISCARCHDHPKVAAWKQDNFFGMKSFFNRTFDNGGFLAERASGTIKFKTKDGQDRLAPMMFLTGKVVDDPGAKEPSGEEQKKEKELFDKAKRSKTPPPPPKFSARAQLVALALQPGQSDYFARSIVNRLWFRFFGYGLVMPLDQMHSENPPSHPELLQWLARDTAEHHYDLRRLIRGLVISRAYARSSRWTSEDLPRPDLFAVARLRPLTPMQLAVALRLATTDPAVFPATLKAEQLDQRLAGLEGAARGLAEAFEQPSEDFQIGVREALFFSNSDRVARELLADSGDRLLGRLKQLKDPAEVIDTAVRAVLSRPPTPDEGRLFSEYLKQRADRPVEAYRQLVWVLLTSSEFRFNY